MLATILWSRRAMRYLLQLDVPVPQRTTEEVEAEARANYRWNFAVNLGDGALFWFGNSFISAATILPLFVSQITTQPLWFALLAVLGQAGWYLPQLLSAGSIERVARKKPVIVNLGFFTERLPVWLMPVAALVSVRMPWLGLALFFVAYAWHTLGAGLVAPAWSDMIASCFPVHRRGRFFGLTSFIGTGLGAVGAIYSGWLLETYPFPLNFALVFLVAAVAILLSLFSLALTREPVHVANVSTQRTGGASRQKIGRILRGDNNFRRYVLVQMLSTLGRMGAGFVTVAAIARWGVSAGTVGQFTAALLIGQTCGNLLAGLVADRHGHKLSQELGILATGLAFGLAWMAPAVAWYYAVFFLMGASQGIAIVSNVLMPLEFARPQNRPTYVGIANTGNGLGNTVAPIVGGLIAVLDYGWLFAASAAVALVALVLMRVAVIEPRRLGEPFHVEMVPTESAPAPQ